MHWMGNKKMKRQRKGKYPKKNSMKEI